MAVDDEKNNENRKRKRGSTKRKLLLNQRVEVMLYDSFLVFLSFSHFFG